MIKFGKKQIVKKSLKIFDFFITVILIGNLILYKKGFIV